MPRKTKTRWTKSKDEITARPPSHRMINKASKRKGKGKRKTSLAQLIKKPLRPGTKAYNDAWLRGDI